MKRNMRQNMRMMEHAKGETCTRKHMRRVERAFGETSFWRSMRRVIIIISPVYLAEQNYIHIIDEKKLIH